MRNESKFQFSVKRGVFQTYYQHTVRLINQVKRRDEFFFVVSKPLLVVMRSSEVALWKLRNEDPELVVVPVQAQ